MLPEHFREYLFKTKKLASDYYFRASKFGDTEYDRRLKKFHLLNDTPFRMVNTV